MTPPGPFMVMLAITTGAVLGASAPVPASAAAPSVEYSRNGGLTWSASAPSFPFSNAPRFVPGDVITETLLIRSLRTDPTFARVSLANVSFNDPLLDSMLTIEGADVSGAGLHATRLSALRGCTSVVPGRVLTRGQIMSVSLTLRVSAALTGQQAQDAAGHFGLTLALSDPVPMIASNACAVGAVLIPEIPTPVAVQPVLSGEGREAAGLSSAGGSLAYPAIIVAGCALGVGWLFLMVTRRRTRADQ